MFGSELLQVSKKFHSNSDSETMESKCPMKFQCNLTYNFIMGVRAYYFK